MNTRSNVSLERYLRYRLGREYGSNPIGVMLRRSFGARTFSSFWQYWNPVYGYYLSRFCYRPVRILLPRIPSVIFTFTVCGFVLHDLPFSWIPLTIVTGRIPFPFVTVWFGLVGIVVILSEAAKMDLRDSSFLTRYLLNATHILIPFIVTMILVHIREILSPM